VTEFGQTPIHELIVRLHEALAVRGEQHDADRAPVGATQLGKSSYRGLPDLTEKREQRVRCHRPDRP